MPSPRRHVLVLGGGDHIVRVYDPVGDVVHPLPRVRCPFPDVTAVLPLPEDPGSYFLVLGRDQQAVRWRLLGPGASAHSAPVAGPRTLELDPLGTGKAQGVATLTASAYLSLDLPPSQAGSAKVSQNRLLVCGGGVVRTTKPHPSRSHTKSHTGEWGHAAQLSTSVAMWSPKWSKWTPRAPMNYGRSSHATVAFGGGRYVLVCGGTEQARLRRLHRGVVPPSRRVIEL